MRNIVIGIVLIIAGVCAISYDRLTLTKREKVLEIGPVEASVTKKKHITLPPIIGGIVLAAGVVFLVFGIARKN